PPGVQPGDPAERGPVRHRAERLRGNNAAQDHRRADPAGPRPGAGRRRGDHPSPAGPRHGLPALRPVPLEDGVRQRRVRAARAGPPRPGGPRDRPALPRDGRPSGLRGTLSVPALRGDAAARRAGARLCGGPQRAPHGRAVRLAGCADARTGRLSPTAIRSLSVLIGLAAWEIYGRAIHTVIFAYPSQIGRAFAELTRTGELWFYLRGSLVVLALGLALAIAIGIPVGV